MQGAAPMPRLLPKRPPGKKVGRTITISEAVWAQVDAVAEETNHSRNEVVEVFLQWAADEHYREESSRPTMERLGQEAERLERLVSEPRARRK